jgi:dTDP-4-dehydrorhamnose reductase
MPQTKLLIFGGGGWLGGIFIKILLKKMIPYVLSDIRADDVPGVKSLLEKTNPTHVISFIGRTHGEGCNTIDYLESNDKLQINLRDNLFAPVSLAMLCTQRDIHFTYIGTGCIFDRNDPCEHVYTEDEDPDFFGSNYSIVKGYTDRIMHLLPTSILNVRIRMPITNEDCPRNFISKIIRYEKVCSIPNSMTVVNSLFPYLLDMMLKKNVGTIHLVNPGVITHNDILQMYKEIVDPSFTWNNFSKEEQNQTLLSKRSNNQLCTDTLKSMYPDVLDIKDAVKECLQSWVLQV